MIWNKSLLAALVGAPLLAMSSIAAAGVAEDTGVAVRGDFDGDGELDTAASSPQADCEKGVVHVAYGAAATTTWSRDSAGISGTAKCGDRFGTSLAAADLNGDGYDDLVVGVPGAEVSGSATAGAIQVIYGSNLGLTATGDQIWHQDSVGVEGVAEPGDEFGTIVSAADFNCDGNTDVVVGAPLEDIGNRADAGAVAVLYGGLSGLTSVNDLWFQGDSGVDDYPEPGDHFGAAVVGGNFNGDTLGANACDDLAVGAPDETVSVTKDGAVYVMKGGSGGLSTVRDQLLSQSVSSTGNPEAQDRFGARLEAADYDADGRSELVVAVPGDACGTGAGEGGHVFFGSSAGLSTITDSLGCRTYGCSVDGAELLCLTEAWPVHGSDLSEEIRLSQNDDIVWGYDGNEIIRASLGDDVIFGGDGDDRISGGPGLDIAIGGYGDDTFVLDMDCAIEEGEVVDGGPGNDIVYSHLTEAELLSSGVLLWSIESFVGIPSVPDACEAFPFTGPVRPARIAMSWPLLPDPTMSTTTASSSIPLVLTNTSDAPLDVTVIAVLHVDGGSSELELGPFTVVAGGGTTVSLDLWSFVPAGVDVESIPPEDLEIPTSAALRVHAEVRTDTELLETPSAPRIFGHLEEETIVLYGARAYRNSFHSGDLRRYRAVGPGASTSARGVSQAHG